MQCVDLCTPQCRGGRICRGRGFNTFVSDRLLFLSLPDSSAKSPALRPALVVHKESTGETWEVMPWEIVWEAGATPDVLSGPDRIRLFGVK